MAQEAPNWFKAKGIWLLTVLPFTLKTLVIGVLFVTPAGRSAISGSSPEACADSTARLTQRTGCAGKSPWFCLAGVGGVHPAALAHQKARTVDRLATLTPPEVTTGTLITNENSPFQWGQHHHPTLTLINGLNAV